MNNRTMKLDDELVTWESFGTWEYIKNCKHLAKLRQLILKSERQSDPKQDPHMYKITIERIR